MTVRLYEPVRLLTDGHLAKGVSRGAIGTVLEDFGTAMLVEFSRPDGTTIAWFPVRREEVAPIEEPLDAETVRRAG